MFCDILSDEHKVIVIFYLHSPVTTWDGTSVHVRDNNEDMGIACVQFNHYTQLKYGWLNGEVMAGHRYHKLGLLPYRIYEVGNSDWLAELEKGNSVHPYHDKTRFMDALEQVIGCKLRCIDAYV